MISHTVAITILKHFILGACFTILVSLSIAAAHPFFKIDTLWPFELYDRRFSADRWASPFFYDREIKGYYPLDRRAPRRWFVDAVAMPFTRTPGIQLIAVTAQAASPTPEIHETRVTPPFWSLVYEYPYPPIPANSNLHNPGWFGEPTATQAQRNVTYIEQATGLPFLAMYGADGIREGPNNTPIKESIWSIRLPWMMEVDWWGRIHRILPLQPIWSGFILNTIFWACVIAFGRWAWVCAVTQPRTRRRFAQHRCVVRRCGFPLAGAERCPECGTEQLPVLLGNRKPRERRKPGSGQ